jgi:RNA polymerase sigma-70 factor (ECF subfamily)
VAGGRDGRRARHDRGRSQQRAPARPGDARPAPAAASDLRAPGDREFRAFKLDVEGGGIAEVTTFDATLFPAFGLTPGLQPQ